MGFDRLSFPVIQQTTELTQLGDLFYFERLFVSANTRNKVVTPTLLLEDNTITLDTFSTSSKARVDIPIQRIGSFHTLELTPVYGIQWYLVEMEVRPLMLGVGMLPRGARQQFPGRSADLSVSMTFELKPFALPMDARLHCIITKMLYIDIRTGAQTVTPVLSLADGTTVTLTSITQTSRGVVERPVLLYQRVTQVQLLGDFTHPDIVLYDIEMDMYLPGTVALGAA